MWLIGVRLLAQVPDPSTSVPYGLILAILTPLVGLVTGLVWFIVKAAKSNADERVTTAEKRATEAEARAERAWGLVYQHVEANMSATQAVDSAHKVSTVSEELLARVVEAMVAREQKPT